MLNDLSTPSSAAAQVTAGHYTWPVILDSACVAPRLKTGFLHSLDGLCEPLLRRTYRHANVSFPRGAETIAGRRDDSGFLDRCAVNVVDV